MTEAKWQSIVEDFRLHTFYVAYDRLYATVTQPTVRFGLALCHSVQPIRWTEAKRLAVLGWWRAEQAKSLARKQKLAMRKAARLAALESSGQVAEDQP